MLLFINQSKTEANEKQDESKTEAKPKQNESKTVAKEKVKERDKEKEKDKEKVKVKEGREDVFIDDDGLDEFDRIVIETRRRNNLPEL